MTPSTQLQGSLHKDLWYVLPPARLGTFLSAVPKNDPKKALELYVWDRDLAASFIADLAIVEIAFRDAVHRAATKEWGAQWYTEMPIDERTESQLASAWKRLPEHVRNNPNRADVPGRLVANCMFGFWVNLFDKGGCIGKGPKRISIDYTKNWRALKLAFPGGRQEAKNQRNIISQQTGRKVVEPGFSREWVHQICKKVHAIRNRVAHHEPLINGFPLPGQRDSQNNQIRLDVEDAHAEILKLARMLDPRLAVWLTHNSRVLEIFNKRPY